MMLVFPRDQRVNESIQSQNVCVSTDPRLYVIHSSWCSNAFIFMYLLLTESIPFFHPALNGCTIVTTDAPSPNGAGASVTTWVHMVN